MTPDREALREAFAARERKVQQAKEFVEKKLRENDGPNPGQSAVLVVNVVPSPDDPESGLLMTACLPDMDIDYIIQSLESWIRDVKAGTLALEPHGLSEGVEVIKQ